VFTSEQFPGRVQMFQYVSDSEAAAEKDRREAIQQKEAPGQKQTAAGPGNAVGVENPQPASVPK
jgi:hypothetical protein